MNWPSHNISYDGTYRIDRETCVNTIKGILFKDLHFNTLIPDTYTYSEKLNKMV